MNEACPAALKVGTNVTLTATVAVGRANEMDFSLKNDAKP